MKCKKCNTALPIQRSSLGYNECVNCSTTDTYGCVDIVYHKTGNTVQIMSKAAAAEVNKHKRRGFGTMLKGGSKTSTYNPKNVKYGCSTVIVGSKESYDRIGYECMNLLEFNGIDSVFSYIDKAVQRLEINKNQAFKLKQVFKAL